MEKKFFNSIYDLYWEKRAKNYGVSRYEKYIIYEIVKRTPKKVFEVGIGNGWPIGVALQKWNIKVCGCDISKRLVESARINLSCSDEIQVGELKNIKIKGKYDVVYCIRSSWYIQDFKDVLKDMLSMTNENGFVIFDIMEIGSLYYLKMSWDLIKTYIYKVLGLERVGENKLYFFSRRQIEKILKLYGMQFYSYNERTITKSKDYWNTPKRIYVCWRGENHK